MSEQKRESNDSEQLEQVVSEENVLEKLVQADSLSDLEISAAEIGNAIDEDASTSLALEAANQTDVLPQLKELQEVVKENARLAKNEINAELAAVAAVDHLENYNIDSPEAKMVKIEKVSDKVQKRFDEQINGEMKEAMSSIGDVFNKSEYPYALIGSNCYIPHTKYSAKIPDDLDVIFGIKDLGFKPEDIGSDGQPTKYNPDSVYGRLLASKNVEIKEVKELTKFGHEKNGCVKIKALITTASGRKIEMEAFAQHMKSEIDAGANTNGIINLGVDQQGIEVVDCDGVKVNIGNEAMAEELYLKNIMNEFPLFDLKGWENKSYLNAKALQRIFNVINLDHEDFEGSINNIISKISNLNPPTEAARQAQKVLSNLWRDFKESKHFNGNGLVDYLVAEKGITVNAKDAEEEHILKTEAAVDLMTKGTQKDMESMYNSYKALSGEIAAYKAGDEKSKADLIGKIDGQIAELLDMGRKYKTYVRQVDGDSPRDFCAYAAIPRLRNYFVKPILLEMLKTKNDLNNKQ